jgi:hypothetical protein
LRSLAFHGQACIRQQIENQYLHSLRAIGGVANVFVRIGIQPALILPSEQLSEARDHPQRFLQVMRGHVRELFEFGIRSSQILDLVRKEFQHRDDFVLHEHWKAERVCAQIRSIANCRAASRDVASLAATATDCSSSLNDTCRCSA